MGVGMRMVLGLAVLAVFAALALDDARRFSARHRVPVSWTLIATGATVLAGFVHLALTPEHWAESSLYGVFFLVAGLIQLLFASTLTRPSEGWGTWRAILAVNLALVAVYVGTRLVPPVGADLPESVDALGVVTVVAELAAAAAALCIMRRHRSRSAAVPPP